MEDNEFPKIQRGNGVANDNLATLGDIMTATLKKIRSLEEKIEDNKKEVVGVNKAVGEVKKTIETIDKGNTPRDKKSFWLLVATVVIGVAGLILTGLALLK